MLFDQMRTATPSAHTAPQAPSVCSPLYGMSIPGPLWGWVLGFSVMMAVQVERASTRARGVHCGNAR